MSGVAGTAPVLLLVLLGACNATSATPAASVATCETVASPPAGEVRVTLRDVATGFDAPTHLLSRPGDASRLLVVEQAGRVRAVENGRPAETSFLDIRDRVSSGGERGLFAIAFHPLYPEDRRVFVHYTAAEGDGDTHVSAFLVGVEPEVADPASEVVLLSLDQPFANHNGGQIAFGPDGKLYVSLGDGGSGNDPQGNGQNLGTLLGKLLRIDVDGASGYTVPGDNPFVGRSGARGEIWSYGLRNAWRFSFDRQTGDLYIGDVGQNAREEVDVAPAPDRGWGANFGWSSMEGCRCRLTGGCEGGGFTLPALDYPLGTEGTCSVIGGYVYRGSAIPALQGHYFYGDFCAGWVRGFRYEGGRAVDHRQWPTLAPGGPFATFGEDAAGELYVLARDGRVFKIVPAP
jgi:glucose/arabinose dehydrogenase